MEPVELLFELLPTTQLHTQDTPNVQKELHQRLLFQLKEAQYLGPALDLMEDQLALSVLPDEALPQ
jgi:hypothetical protein